MSLVGLRDMSLIETPPRDRLAIQTVVAPFNEELVRTAIENELAREGQVYFIHNRVESIYSLATLVTKLVPKARVSSLTVKWAKKNSKASCLNSFATKPTSSSPPPS